MLPNQQVNELQTTFTMQQKLHGFLNRWENSILIPVIYAVGSEVSIEVDEKQIDRLNQA